MTMCNSCGHARMVHRSGLCTICGANCGTGYVAVVNTMHPVTPKAVGGPSSRHGRAAASPLSRERDKASNAVASGVKATLLSFVSSNLSAPELIALTERLEQHHGGGSTAPSVWERFETLVEQKLTHETAWKYLDALRQRKADGLPLIRAVDRL
jgi:hypothetical protein